MEWETLISTRFPVFLGLFALFAFLERWAPRRQLTAKRSARWITNWGITIVNTLFLRAMAFGLPLLAVGAALDASHNGLGLLNMVAWSFVLELLIAILVLDFVIWAQHLITHKVPFLWRLHRVHHADTDLDVTTAIRFHPVEIAVSMLLKIGVVYLLGPAAVAVVLFEILLNGTAMFNHANIKLPLWLDAVVRRVLVTPDMHRIHHSVHRHEHDSNYGFALSIWDRMFGTYIETPEAGQTGMQIGLEWQDDRPTRFGWSLALPFFRK